MLKMVNQSVAPALERLGYSEAEVDGIIAYIDAQDTIEGAPRLLDEHLPIFDCAFRPRNGQRSINYLGHLKMMAAAQPFVSGAISKTVNLPESASVEDIFNAYIESWKMGLKAVAIYRDNSKRSQPLATDNSKGSTVKTLGRRHLPNERPAITHKFNIQGHEGYITVGIFEDGTPGEIFLVMAKEGSTLSGIMDAFATSISLALQYGVPLSALVKKFSHMRFEPSGMTQNPQIPFAKSIADYIFRWLASRFLSEEEQLRAGIVPLEDETSSSKKALEATVVRGKEKGSVEPGLAFELSDDAPPCSSCGSSLMVRQGACYRCLNCGSQGGCG
jgi:ribonucleoside-diphosphate reductase alpha chain